MNRSEELDRRITIERFTSTPNDLNEPIETWSTFLDLWANRSDVSDGERFAAGQVGSFLMTRFTVRHSPDTKTITPKDRINYDGALWSIVGGPKETRDGRNNFLEITAVRRAE